MPSSSTATGMNHDLLGTLCGLAPDDAQGAYLGVHGVAA